MTGTYRDGALSKDSPTEHARLSAIQNSADAGTISVLEGLSIADDWDCLDLGAGAGSIAYWLAERCPRGRVVANDVDVRYLTADRGPHLEVHEADITAAGFAPGRFDLVHARFVLCHLPQRDEVIAHAVADWLKPGGVLVVTDPYQLPAETSRFPLVRRLMAAYQQVYAGHGADLQWARGLPSVLAGAGLTEIDYTGKLGCMGNQARDRWRPLITQVAPAMIADGLLRQGDIDDFLACLDDPAFIDIPQFTITAWGRARPPRHL